MKTNYNLNLENRCFFQGLCDLSFVSFEKENRLKLGRNFPLLNKGYDIPFDIIEKFNFPVLNLGPYGKDPHKKTERLELNYSFEILPNLFKELIHYSFGKINI